MVFLSMNHDAEGQEILQSGAMARFDPVEDVAYDAIRRMAADAANVRLSAQV